METMSGRGRAITHKTGCRFFMFHKNSTKSHRTPHLSTVRIKYESKANSSATATQMNERMRTKIEGQFLYTQTISAIRFGLARSTHSESKIQISMKTF